MTRRIVLPLLAVMGVGLAITAIMLGDRTPEGATTVVNSVVSPFATSVAGTGIAVKWGDRVKSGDLLFKIEDRDLQGQLLVANAKVKEAEAGLAKVKNLLDVGEGLSKGSSISVVDLANRRFDVAINEGIIASAKAQVEQLKIEVDRRTVRAPVSGRILQIKIRPGEYAQSGMVNPPLMLLGDDTRLHVRVDINENDAWRVKPTAPAMAYIPGNPDLRMRLQFERIEPYAVPKVSLTGESTERTDTRVLQVIYSFERGELPIYIGQRMNVHIEGPAAADAGVQSANSIASRPGKGAR
jgi:HlyD family secretion protein